MDPRDAPAVARCEVLINLLTIIIAGCSRRVFIYKCATLDRSFVSEEIMEEVVKTTEPELRLDEQGAERYNCAERQHQRRL